MLNDIVQEMKELYLSNSKPWVVSCSFGKDSSLCLEYTFQMLLSLPKEKRHKTVYVLTSNTLVETNMMSAFMKKSIHYVQRAAKELDLPIVAETAISKLKDRLFFNSMERGLLVISTKLKGRWCVAPLAKNQTVQAN